MKSVKLIVLVAAGVVLAVAVGLVVSAELQGKEMTITGEVVDMWCYMQAGARGADHKACAIACAKAGEPIGILDAKGNLYLAMGATDKLQPAKDMLGDKMAETVIVIGKVINKGGVKAIFIESIKEMPKEMPKGNM